MIKILTVIGARPQIIKAAAISRTIKEEYQGRMREIIVHTGQHYDKNMSEVFFSQMGIPLPDHNLNVGSLPHGQQTARMIEGIEELLHQEKPDFVVIYGDTNSTLAAAIAASKLHFKIAHIEAGLRSYNKSMPEEINRILSDHVSTLLFSPTSTGYNNLRREGFSAETYPPYTPDNPKIFHCGDVMYDNMLHYSNMAEQHSLVLQDQGITKDKFLLVTIHRDNNTDNPDRLKSIFQAILDISNKSGLQAVLPLHPRTLKLMPQNLPSDFLEEINSNPLIKFIPPASFFDMIVLEKHCQIVLTDSGGVQKEAWFNQKPCIILRPETEWKEIIEHGAGIIADANYSLITEAFDHFSGAAPIEYPPIYGDGKAASFICREIFEAV
jgi:UDP-GlcNAc3NAcA epimerase